MSRPGGAKNPITIVGGGIAGLTAAITCAEGGVPVLLQEAHDRLGGRARTDGGLYKANFGPHALYKDGPFWRWMAERGILPPNRGLPLAPVKLQARRRDPPYAALDCDSFGPETARPRSPG